LLPLIAAFGAARPDVAILVTSGTVTSAELMSRRLPKAAIHQFAPIDAPKAAAAFLAHWRPNISLFVESEIWPNLILGAKASGSRLALVSARLSEKSLRGWARTPRSARTIFSAFDLVMAQDDGTCAALARLGARNDGRLNLKRLGGPLPVDADSLDAVRAAAGETPLLLAASTHVGEDEIILEALRPLQGQARLVITPRHPNRGPAIRSAAAAAGFTAGLRSENAVLSAQDVYIADTLGELGLWYRASRAAFIGGSLLKGPGGHNPVEAAEFDIPMITGPHLDNWRDIYADLTDVDGVAIVADAVGLSAAFIDVLQNPPAAAARAARARKVLTRDEDAVTSAVEHLISLLP
jgi:3-deoxy-D-manno-octulosonic-acid transferase